MIAHLFKLIWNKKKQNFLLMLEMLVSFLVIFTLFTVLVYYYRNYKRPMGFTFNNIWTLKYDNPAGMTNADTIATFNAQVKNIIKSIPNMEEVSFTSINSPFGNAHMGGGITYKDNSVQSSIYHVEENYKDMLGISIKEGRWFSKEDRIAKEKIVVINETLRRKLFGNEDVVGKSIPLSGIWEKTATKVVGVIADLKDQGDYAGEDPGFYLLRDTSNQGRNGSILIKVKPGTGADTEKQLYKTLSNAFRNTSVDILHLTRLRQEKIAQMTAPVAVLLIITSFLIVNVALGLFGVLWYNINKRKSEMGLRKAVGASSRSIAGQMIAEVLVLSTISLMVGSFFAIQFPLLSIFDVPSATYLIALLLSVLFIYLLVIVCALYPGKQAAAIYPAVALHED